MTTDDDEAPELRGDGHGDDTRALMALLRRNSPGRAALPPGRFLTTGLSLRGLSCSIVGCDDATVIAALPGQSGPVLDFRGYISPRNMNMLRTVGGFAIEGDGTPGPEKRGILLGEPGDDLGCVVGMVFSNISVEKTGGCCLELSHSQLNHFERITLNTPVDCVANDVPYIRGVSACNGNRLVGIGLRSSTNGNDCPRGGAARFLTAAAGDYSPNFNVLREWWVEYLHPSPGSAILAIAGNANVVRDWMLFDTMKEPGATGTACYRLLDCPENYGGNLIEGYIPSGGAIVDAGVELFSPGNVVVGVRGYGPGGHVLLHPGAAYTSVHLYGAESQPAGTPYGEVVGVDGRPTTLDDRVTISVDATGNHSWGGDPKYARLVMAGGREWTSDGLRPGGFVKWPGSGGLGPGPDESLRYVGWSVDTNGNRRQRDVVPPLKGK